jgi:hypothetical protein
MTSVVTGTIELPKSGYTVYGCYYNDPIKLIKSQLNLSFN